MKKKIKATTTFCNTTSTLVLLHLPWLKLPQDPLGVPKLANLIKDMT